MLSRFVSFGFAIVSSLSMGLALPAHAENHAKSRQPAQASPDLAKLEELRLQLVEKVKKVKVDAMRVYDKDGREVSFDDLVSNPGAFRDGVGISVGQHRLQFKGEVITDGPKGLKIFVSHSLNDGPVDSGQVITLSPEMTKRAIEQRFRDAVESLMIATTASAGKSDAKRGVANAAATGDRLIACFWTVILATVTVVFLLGHQGNPAYLAIAAKLGIAAAAGVATYTTAKQCF